MRGPLRAPRADSPAARSRHFARAPPPLRARSDKFSASGTLYLSTLRLVVVCKPGSSFAGFDLPLATMEKERFNQPIFGANNMTGVNPPLDGTTLTAEIKWCVAFHHGGVGTFLPFFFRLIQDMRSRMSQQQQAAPQPMNEAQVQSMVQGAFIDPSDPTTLYVAAKK